MFLPFSRVRWLRFCPMFALVVLGVVATPILGAAPPLGPIAEARAKYPESFVPGLVTQETIAGKSSYVICVCTEVVDSSSKGEPLEDIRKELTLSSRKLLFEYLVPPREAKRFEVIMKGYSSLFLWRRGDTCFANYYVPKAGVKIKRLPPPKPPKVKEEPPVVVPPPVTTVPAKSPVPKPPDLTPQDIQEKFSKLFGDEAYAEALKFYDAKASLIPNPPGGLRLLVAKARCLVKIEEKVDLHANSMKLASLYEKEGDYASALKCYQALLDSKQGSEAERVEAYDRAVDCGEKAKEYDKAIELLEKLQKEYPFSTSSRDAFRRISDLKRKQFDNR